LDESRRDEIYAEIPSLNVTLAENPTTLGPGYIAVKIQECHVKAERANELWIEAGRAFDHARNLVRTIKLEKHFFERQAFLLPEISELRVSMAEKQYRAEIRAESLRVEIRMAEAPEGEVPDADLETPLEQQLAVGEAEEEALKSIRDQLNEMRSHIRTTISSVRLQHQAIEQELKYLRGGGGHGGGTAPVDTPPEGEQPGSSEEWENLQG
jgi:hypothetical protein